MDSCLFHLDLSVSSQLLIGNVAKIEDRCNFYSTCKYSVPLMHRRADILKTVLLALKLSLADKAVQNIAVNSMSHVSFESSL